MAFARNVLHSVFSEKQGSQPEIGWSVAFRRSVRKPCKRIGYGLQGRAVQDLSGFCSFKVVMLIGSLGFG
jgi:hypothetical protein